MSETRKIAAILDADIVDGSTKIAEGPAHQRSKSNSSHECPKTAVLTHVEPNVLPDNHRRALVTSETRWLYARLTH